MKKILRILFLLLLLISMVGAKGGEVIASPAEPGKLPVITPIPDGLILDWQIPQVDFTRTAEGQVQVNMAGLEYEITPGLPELPMLSLLVALPPDGIPTIQLNKSDQKIVSVTGPVSLVPKPEPARRADSSPIEVDSVDTVDQSPQVVAVLEEVGIMRGVRLGRLVLRPVLLQGNQFTIYNQIQLTLTFNTPVFPTSMPGDAMIDQVKAMVVNPSQVQSSLANMPRSALAPQAAQVAPPAMIMEISQPGLYQVTYENLQAAGFDPTLVDPRNIHITHGGQEVAYEWAAGSQDGVFSSGETLRFIAKPDSNRWAAFDTYTLTVMGTPGTLMATRDATPGSAAVGLPFGEKLFEQNKIYIPDNYVSQPVDTTRDGDPWVWDELRAGDTRDYAFDLGTIDPAQAGMLTLYLNGFTTLTHNVDVGINGTFLGSFPVWSGKKAKQAQFYIPGGRLGSTGNTLNLHMTLPPGSVDGVWFDAFVILYKLGSTPLTGDAFFLGGSGSGTFKYSVDLNSPTNALAYNLSAVHTPVRLTGIQRAVSPVTLQDTSATGWPSYLVTTNLRSLTPNVTLRKKTALLTAATTGADYVIITHPNFLSGLSGLVTQRKNKGLSVATENVKAIYDAYSDGIPTPQAIQDYLKAIYNAWSPKPQYVLLVGDSTWDVKDYLNDPGNPNISFIPPFLKQVDPFTVEEAADNRFATLDGATDVLADMMIGRLPVNDAAQLSTMISKIANYENNPPPGDWRKKGTIIADHPLGYDYPFTLVADNFFSSMSPAPFYRQKIYYQVNYPTGSATLAAILQAWNMGTALITYSGHSSFHQWGGKSPNELFFHIDNVTSLSNGFKLPALLEMTCYTSQFHLPGFNALDEAIVRSATGGAIVTFGSTGPGYSGSHTILGTGFIEGMQSGVATAGQAMMAGKLKLITKDPNNKYLADTFLLLGDPAVTFQLQIIKINSTYLPLIGR